MTPALSYFVCTLPRSGSWLLSESLEKTGVAGRPREYFDPKLFAEEPTSPELLDKILTKGMTKNRVFSAKLHWYQFEFMPRLIGTNGDSELPVPLLLNARFPGLRYIWLTRRDKTRQAISYYRASKTGQWWRIRGLNADETLQTPPYDFDRIYHLEHVLIDNEGKWQKYFEEHDIDPLVLVYEEIADDPTWAIKEVLNHIGVSCPKRIKARPRLLRQRDSITEEWFDRYTAGKKATKRAPLNAPQ